MIEYDNTLRLVTTVTHNVGSSSQSNSVYVLDADLKTIGKIEDLAKNEQVYSARFLGDTGYFVTYEQTDPFILRRLFRSGESEDPWQAENSRLFGNTLHFTVITCFLESVWIPMKMALQTG